jgi:hypothetical protein
MWREGADGEDFFVKALQLVKMHSEFEDRELLLGRQGSVQFNCHSDE